MSPDTDSIRVNLGSPPSSSPLHSSTAEHETKFHQSLQQELKNDLSAVTEEGSAMSEGKMAGSTEESEPEVEPRRLRFVIDPAGDLTHDQTTVDVVTVPCPGGHPQKTWARDGLLGRYFGAPSMRDAERLRHESEEQRMADGPSWVRQGIRREADRARILLYEHPELGDGVTTLNTLAEALLEELGTLREREGDERPLLFLGHSLGGIVIKMALAKAGRDTRFEGILRQCYGVAFFATPHQGSSYFAMPSLASSIQSLLQLSRPLPTSITDDLRVGNQLLLHADDEFKTISTDLRVWTFYETIESRLSGSGPSDYVYFTAPLTSIKSAILGMRQESIFPLQSDHANIASFGRHNVHTLRMFLKQLAVQISRADEYSRESNMSWALNLEQKVNIEVHGFFEDPIGPDSVETAVRAWSTRLPLKEFLRKGPDACLAERLNEVDGIPDEGRFMRSRGRTSIIVDPEEEEGKKGHTSTTEPILVATTRNVLGIKEQIEMGELMSPPTSPIIRAIDADHRGFRSESTPHIIGNKVVGGPFTPPLRPTSPPTRYSTPMRRASPLFRANFDQDLAIDRLSPPIHTQGINTNILRRSLSAGSEASRFEYRDFPPFSQRSRSLIDGNLSGNDNDEDVAVVDDTDDDGGGPDASPRLPEALVPIRRTVRNGDGRKTVIVDEVPVAFTRPDAQARKFVWIHLPYNNPAWVAKVFETLQVSYKRNLSPLFNQDFWAMRHTRGRHPQHYAYFAKPGCYFTSPRPTTPMSHRSVHGSLSPRVNQGVYTCLFMPYLHFDSYKRLLRRREMILQRLNHGRSRPVPESVAKSDSVELQVIWEYLGHDPPVNCRRTLDQYGYPSLRDTRTRDDDQMLYKLTKERVHMHSHARELNGQGSTLSDVTGSTGSWRGKMEREDQKSPPETKNLQDDVLNGNVLMVDQLWLWAVDSHTLLTFFPKREGDAIEGPLYQQADLRDSIFSEVNVDLTRQCDNALDLAALAVLHAVSVLLDKSSHPDLEVFRIFEEAISILTEKLTTSLKLFRTEGFRDKASALDTVENRERSIRARHQAEGQRAEEENRDNTSALLELRDMEDELLLLLSLFERQSKVISSMHTVYMRPEMRDITVNGRGFLNEASKKLSEYSHQTHEMVQRVRTTRDDYEKLLQMVQRQAQVDEVRLSRLHADVASAQSRSVMIFTVFTVIFLPLTFFTGLFGMNTQEWGGDNNLPLKLIGIIALPSSFVLIVASLVIAWSNNVRKFLLWLSDLHGKVARWMFNLVCVPLHGLIIKRVATMARGQGQRAEDREAKAMLNKEASDFWERHRLERERGYHVPEKNKRSVMRARLNGRSRGSK